MEIKEFDINKIIPYSNNPRKNEGAVEIVMKSIREFGFKVPIVVNKDNIIIAGHTRLKAAQLLGMKRIPCIIASDLNEEQIKAFRLVDNKTSEYSEWDLTKLQEELRELNDLDFDMGLFDFKLQEDAKEDEFNLEEVLGSISIPTTKEGDAWILGRHRLVCGDSTLKADMKKLMAGELANLVITDPPYNVDYTGGTKSKMKILNDSMPDAKFRAFLTDAYKVMFDVMEAGAPIYVFHADGQGNAFRSAFHDTGFKMAQILIWVKQNFVLGRQDYQWRHEPILYGWKEGAAHRWYGEYNKDTVLDEDKINYSKAKREELVQIIKDMQQKMYGQTTVIYHDKPSLSAEHPTMKPVKLIGKLMNNSSQAGDLVLDPFGGSGSTLIAAEQLNRACYTMEVDPVYCDVIVKRWEDYTGCIASRGKTSNG